MAVDINAVFKGGGAKGIAYAGAIRAAEEAGLRFRAVAGSSAGAITATLVSAGYVAAELTDLLPEALSRLDSVLAAAPKLHRAALLSNQSLGDWLNDKLLAKIGGADHPTFAVLRARTGVDLYVVAMDLASRQPVVFSPDLTPDVSVVHAVLASASIPVAFPPQRMRDECEVVRLVDGGVWANYPSFVFIDKDFRSFHGIPEESASRPTIGFVLDDGASVKLRGAKLTAVGPAALSTDAGSAERELNSPGALLASPLLRWTMVLSPALMLLLLLGWIRTESRSGLSTISWLPTGLQELIVLGAATFAALGLVLALVSSFLVARIGRSLLDVGLVGASAAMGVGPSVPYWVGHAHRAGDLTSSHVVVRIPPARGISTLSFSPSEHEVALAVETGYLSTRSALAATRLGDARGIGKARSVLPPPATEAFPPPAEGSAVEPSSAETFRTRFPRAHSALIAVGWAWALMAAVSVLPMAAVPLLVGIRDGQYAYLLALIPVAALTLYLLWRHARRRHKSAIAESTFLRRRSTPTLILIATTSLAMAVAATLSRSDEEFSLIDLLNSERTEAEIAAVGPPVDMVALPEGLPVEGCTTWPFETYVPADGSADRPAQVGDTIEVRVDLDTCSVLVESVARRQLESLGSLIFYAVLGIVLAVRALATIRWRQQFRRDLAGSRPSPQSTKPV